MWKDCHPGIVSGTRNVGYIGVYIIAGKESRNMTTVKMLMKFLVRGRYLFMSSFSAELMLKKN